MASHLQVECIEMTPVGSTPSPGPTALRSIAEGLGRPPSNAASSHHQDQNNLSPQATQPSARDPGKSMRKPNFIAFASTVLVFTCRGLNFAFGVYQELYESLSHDSSSPFHDASPALVDLIAHYFRQLHDDRGALRLRLDESLLASQRDVSMRLRARTHCGSRQLRDAILALYAEPGSLARRRDVSVVHSCRDGGAGKV